jgi:hypothetical protein
MRGCRSPARFVACPRPSSATHAKASTVCSSCLADANLFGDDFALFMLTAMPRHNGSRSLSSRNSVGGERRSVFS